MDKCGKKWVTRFENFACAMGITKNDRKRAMLLHYAGEDVYNIFDTLQDTGTSNDYNIAKQMLEDHFNPQKTLNSKYINLDKQSKIQRKQWMAIVQD
jgi:hypothetical protein